CTTCSGLQSRRTGCVTVVSAGTGGATGRGTSSRRSVVQNDGGFVSSGTAGSGGVGRGCGNGRSTGAEVGIPLAFRVSASTKALQVGNRSLAFLARARAIIGRSSRGSAISCGSA